MRLYPAIDLKNGKCVRLVQGDYNAVTIYHDNPVVVAKEWERQGATYLHIVDLDGAKEGMGINDAVIREIVEQINIPVQVGGGIRSLEAIQVKLDQGVSRVILGSIAVSNTQLLSEAIERFGSDQVVIGIDAKNGMVAVEGWCEVSNEEAINFAKKVKSLGVKTIIYTDIAKDGMMQGPNVEMTRKLIQETGLQVIASGGVRSEMDLEEVQRIGAEGAIIGKALYTGDIMLEAVTGKIEGKAYVK